MSRTRREFTNEFKNHVVQEAIKSGQASEVADNHDIPLDYIRRWKKQGYGMESNVPLANDDRNQENCQHVRAEYDAELERFKRLTDYLLAQLTSR
jgi:transposase-like protein